MLARAAPRTAREWASELAIDPATPPPTRTGRLWITLDAYPCKRWSVTSAVANLIELSTVSLLSTRSASMMVVLDADRTESELRKSCAACTARSTSSRSSVSLANARAWSIAPLTSPFSISFTAVRSDFAVARRTSARSTTLPAMRSVLDSILLKGSSSHRPATTLRVGAMALDSCSCPRKRLRRALSDWAAAPKSSRLTASPSSSAAVTAPSTFEASTRDSESVSVFSSPGGSPRSSTQGRIGGWRHSMPPFKLPDCGLHSHENELRGVRSGGGDSDPMDEAASPRCTSSVLSRCLSRAMASSNVWSSAATSVADSASASSRTRSSTFRSLGAILPLKRSFSSCARVSEAALARALARRSRSAPSSASGCALDIPASGSARGPPAACA
mmetsp:Transcript_17935/g.57320  ORF Transcript_17935/g.57320 Transcript_17935/m.57320 type:complete len:389 (+) Transcript_17935:888-2054(+)